jgi:hypothetical protein
LKPNGVFINVSAPEWNFPELNPLLFLMYQAVFAGSAAGKIYKCCSFSCCNININIIIFIRFS